MTRRIIALSLLIVFLVGCDEEKKDCNCSYIPELPTPIILETFEPFAVVEMPDQNVLHVYFSVQHWSSMTEQWSQYLAALLIRQTTPSFPFVSGGQQITINILPFSDPNASSLEDLLPADSEPELLQVGGLEALRIEYVGEPITNSEGFIVFAKIDDTLYARFQVTTAIGEKAQFEVEAMEILNTFQVTNIQREAL